MFSSEERAFLVDYGEREGGRGDGEEGIGLVSLLKFRYSILCS